MQNSKPDIKLVADNHDDDEPFDEDVFIARFAPNNEIELSRSFAIATKDAIRYVRNEKAWLIWSGLHWEHDIKGKVSYEVSESV